MKSSSNSSIVVSTWYSTVYTREPGAASTSASSAFFFALFALFVWSSLLGRPRLAIERPSRDFTRRSPRVAGRPETDVPLASTGCLRLAPIFMTSRRQKTNKMWHNHHDLASHSAPRVDRPFIRGRIASHLYPLTRHDTSSTPNHTQLCGDDDDTNDHHERLRGEARGEDRAVSLFQGFSYGQSG